MNILTYIMDAIGVMCTIFVNYLYLFFKKWYHILAVSQRTTYMMYIYSIVLSLLFFTIAQAQVPLYDFSSQGGTNPSPLPYINSTQDINLDFDAIKAFPDSILLEFTDSTTTVIQKDKFFPRSGYLFVDDEDPPETPPFWVDPAAIQSDFSFMWSGSNDNYDVVITTYQGLLSATISGNTARYVIKKQGADYQLIDVNLSGFPSYEGDVITTSNNKALTNKINQGVDKSYVSNLKSFDFESKNITQNKDVINPNIIDILIVYNEAARIEAGGLATDPNDTLHMEQQIIAEVDNLNTALANSANSIKVTKFHVAKVNDFVHASGSGDTSLITMRNFRTLNSIKLLRNQVGADIVSGILDTNITGFPFCGRGWAQTSSDGSWIIGAGFSEFAYNITQQLCTLFDNTFTHEFGHNLGANHQRSEHTTNYISTVTNNGYPYAFAHQDGSFISINSSAGNDSRRLNFANPNVQVDGVNTGIANIAHNQRVIEELTVYASNYRQRPDLIFANGME